MATNTTPQRIQRTTLTVVTLLGLLAAGLLIMKPFIPALIWATTIVVASWPLMLKLQARLGGHRGIAVALMISGLMAILVIPIYLAIATIVSSTDQVTAFAATLDHRVLPPPPGWLESLPLIGPKAAETWRLQTAGGASALVASLKPYVATAARALASQAGIFGAMVIQFLLTLIISAMLFMNGEAASRSVRTFFRRLAGEQGEAVVVLSGKAIRSVALGVVVTALSQTLLAGLGLYFAQVPYAGLLTAVALILCVAQVGPGLLLIPAIIWLFATGKTGYGTFLLIWSIAPMTIDNFMRPYFIKKGVDLPLWLIFSGVLGGLLAFGIIGLFIGPVVLAVIYTLMDTWGDEPGSEPAASS
jgi:predicted PurR-regulated permease PerM